MLKRAGLICALFLAGCTTTAKYEETLNSWIGAQEAKLVQVWGPPDSVYEISESEKMLTYQRSYNMHLPGSPPNYQTTIVGDTAHTTAYGGSAASTVNFNCKTTFTILDGVVSRWQWQGNDCRQ